ncbi:MAG TPA: MFS transporter [Actinospica sp.]|nr:MFS transporter [Actinospica sp.]
MGKRAWLLLIGGLVSSIGDRFAAIAYALFAVSVHSPGLLSAVFAAELVPPLLLGLIGGVVTDKALRRWLWPTVLILQTACFTAMSQADTSTPWLIVVLVAVSSSLASLIGPVGTVLLRGLVTDESQHGNAARWTAVSSGFAGVGGTVAAAATFQASATHVLFLVDAASFLILALLGALAVRNVPLPTSPRSPLRPADAFTGFPRLTSPATFGRSGMAMLIGVMFGTSLEGIVGVFFLRNVMHVNPTMYGVVIGSWSAGMLAGPALLRPRTAHTSWRHLMPVSAIAMGICIAVPALAVDQWTTVVAFTLGGAANGLFNVGITSAIFQGVPQHEQGRAWPAFGILAGACALLGYLTGAAVGAGYARETMLVSGVLPATVGLVALVRPTKPRG